jgi:hypothetical protein
MLTAIFSHAADRSGLDHLECHLAGDWGDVDERDRRTKCANSCGSPWDARLREFCLTTLGDQAGGVFTEDPSAAQHRRWSAPTPPAVSCHPATNGSRWSRPLQSS